MSTHTRTATCLIDISADKSVSLPVFIGGEFSLIGIKYPDVWTAAAITFLVSADGVNYANLLDDAGTEVSKTVTASQYRELDSAEFKSAIYLKIRSGTAATPVEQEEDREFTLVQRRYVAR